MVKGESRLAYSQNISKACNMLVYRDENLNITTKIFFFHEQKLFS